MSGADYDGAVNHILTRLRNELSPKLTFHSVWHTESDVLPAAMWLARAHQVPEPELLLIRVAAAFHDSGYLKTLEGHEQVSAWIAAHTLPGFGFSRSQVRDVVDLILATQTPQCPGCLAQEILADADLDVLGREDFFSRNAALHQETINLGHTVNRRQWFEAQLQFLKNHSYFTDAARSRREATKQKHIAILRDIISRNGEEQINGVGCNQPNF